MAVIITDMQMPLQCVECPFHFRTDNAHTACSRNPMEKPVEDGDERPKHCPLKEVEEQGYIKTMPSGQMTWGLQYGWGY